MSSYIPIDIMGGADDDDDTGTADFARTVILATLEQIASGEAHVVTDGIQASWYADDTDAVRDAARALIDTIDGRRRVPIMQWFEAVASDDDLKRDLELTCTKCGEHVCDVEHQDSLSTLENVARDHWQGAGHGNDPAENGA